MPIRDPYNWPMRSFSLLGIAILTLWASVAPAQSAPPLVMQDKNLPEARLWEPYSFQFHASGGIAPYQWQLGGGDLPHGFALDSHGEIAGGPSDGFHSELSILLTDSSRPPKQVTKDFTLKTAVPLTADWAAKAKVNGRRIEGSLKISNQTGRDFDLTVIVLAIDDISRATAIGYQHFSLKRDTHEMEVPFGENLARGNYVVNVDAVGEEGISGRIFRARLVTENLPVTQGP